MSLPAHVRDVAILLARVAVGVIFVAHGWQKLGTNGIGATASFFGSVGVPMPEVAAWLVTLVELVAGVALIAGLLVPVAALLLAVDMAGAFIFVHAGNGLFVQQNGFELVLALAAGCLALAASGAGAFSLDRVLFGRSRRNIGAGAVYEAGDGSHPSGASMVGRKNQGQS